MRRLWLVVAAVALMATTNQVQDPTPEWALPSSGLLHGSKATIENQPCCGRSRNSRVESADSAALANWSGLASRGGRKGESPLPKDKPDAKQRLRVEGGTGQWQC